MSLVNLATFCSSVLLLHICASRWLEIRCRKTNQLPEGERASVPRSEALRSWYYVLFTVLVSVAALFTKYILEGLDCNIWRSKQFHYSYEATHQLTVQRSYLL